MRLLKEFELTNKLKKQIRSDFGFNPDLRIKLTKCMDTFYWKLDENGEKYFGFEFASFRSEAKSNIASPIYDQYERELETICALICGLL